MSWSIEFVLYSEAKTGDSVHTISDPFDFELDAQSTTGVDYFSQEVRFGKFKFDSDSWIDANLFPFLSGSVEGIVDLSPYWNYVIRLKYGGNVEYIGYISRDMVKYNKAWNEYEIRTVDILKIVKSALKNINYTNTNYIPTSFDIKTYLDAIFLIIKTTYSLDFDYTNSFEYDFGFNFENYHLYSADVDQQLEYALSSTPISYSGFDWYISPENLTQYPTANEDFTPSKSIIYFYEDNSSLMASLFLQYRYYAYNVESGNQQGSSIMIHVTMELINNSFENKEIFYQQDTSPIYTEYQDVYDWFDEDSAYNSYYVNGGHSTSNILEITFGNDYYTYLSPVSGNATGIIFYTGIAEIEEVTPNNLAIGTNAFQWVNLCLLLQNATLSISKDGNIESIHRDYELNQTESIDDDDIYSIYTSGILSSDVDFASALSLLIETEKDSLTEPLKSYYSTKLEEITSNSNIRIENNYDLLLNQKITVYGQDYKINSIKLDNDRFVYQIKAWRI